MSSFGLATQPGRSRQPGDALQGVTAPSTLASTFKECPRILMSSIKIPLTQFPSKETAETK